MPRPLRHDRRRASPTRIRRQLDVFPPQSGKVQLIFLYECYEGPLEGRHEADCYCMRCGCGSALLTCVEPGGSGGQFRSGSLRWLGSGHAVWDSGGESAAGLLRGTPTTYVHSKLLLDARQPGVGWIPLAQAAHSGVRLNRAGRRNRKAQLGRRAAGRAPVSESRDLLVQAGAASKFCRLTASTCCHRSRCPVTRPAARVAPPSLPARSSGEKPPSAGLGAPLPPGICEGRKDEGATTMLRKWRQPHPRRRRFLSAAPSISRASPCIGSLGTETTH